MAKKSLKQLLHSDVSLSNVKELLTAEIPIPFAESGFQNYQDVLGAAGHSEEELNKMFQELEQQGRSIEGFLVEKGFLSAADLEKSKADAETSGLNLFQVLVSNKLVTPAAITDIVVSLQREIIDQLEGGSLQKALVSKKLVAKEKVEKAREVSKTERISFEQALLKTKALTLDKLGKVYKEKYSIPTIKLKLKNFDVELLSLVPEDLMREKLFVPFKKEEDKLALAMADPRDALLIDKLNVMSNVDIQPYFADASDIQKILEKHLAKPVAPPPTAEMFSEESLTEIQKLVDSESTVKMAQKIIEGAVNARATDVHLEPQEKTFRIRYRIDGMLYDFMTLPKERSIPVISRLKILASMDISERRRPQDGHIFIAMEEHDIDIRAATLPTVLGEKVVLRILEKSAVLKGLNQLGFEESDLEKLRWAVHAPNGMVLVTGPIGSGKTTTLYSALNEVNVQTRNIVTVEDPVEYQLPGINQVQVDTKIGLTFANGLRAILRQDANVLMVGEIRDAETAKVAVRASLTGHLLLSTLHTNSALGAVMTLYHLGVESFLLASSVNCVVAQRLVRKVCASCCEMKVPSAALRKQLGLSEKSRKKIPFPKGCKECFHTGYIGRTAVYEVITLSEKLREMIINDASEAELEAASRKEKNKFLWDNGKKKVLDGVTTFEEIIRTIYM